jgi:hypothetical protein
MMNRMPATMIAGHPMCAHIAVKLNPIALVLSPGGAGVYPVIRKGIVMI